MPKWYGLQGLIITNTHGTMAQLAAAASGGCFTCLHAPASTNELFLFFIF
jgi:hypothetical protein